MSRYVSHSPFASWLFNQLIGSFHHLPLVLHSNNLTTNLHVNVYLIVLGHSDVPSPSVSPCGICRQFIREFCSLDTPIYMVGSTYTESDKELKDDGETMVMKTLEELLPMSFGPEFLGKKKV